MSTSPKPTLKTRAKKKQDSEVPNFTKTKQKKIEFSKLIPYLFKMKEFWKLKEEIKDNFLGTISSGMNSKEIIKSKILKVLESLKKKSKLSLILKNAENNYKIDNDIIDNEGKMKMKVLTKKWPMAIQNRIDDAFDMVAEQLKLLKRAQKDKNFEFKARHITIFSEREIMVYFGQKDPKGEKLVKFDSVYFKIPTLESLRIRFKELNTAQFGHIGSLHDTAIIADKDKSIESFLTNVKSGKEVNKKFRNYLKFGIPNGIRYKFYKTMVSKWADEEEIRENEHEKPELSDSEVEMFRFILYEDVNVNFNISN